MEVGSTIICRNCGSGRLLTLNKSYRVLNFDTTTQLVTVFNDWGTEDQFSAWRFEIQTPAVTA